MSGTSQGRQGPPQNAELDAAVIDVLEGTATAAQRALVDADPGARAAVAEFGALRDKVRAMPLPEVDPSVRSVVLSAAIQETLAQEAREGEAGGWAARALAWFLRPAPILGTVAVAAVAAAVVIRTQAPEPKAYSSGGEVALGSPHAPAGAQARAEPKGDVIPVEPASLGPVAAPAPAAPPPALAATGTPAGDKPVDSRAKAEGAAATRANGVLALVGGDEADKVAKVPRPEALALKDNADDKAPVTGVADAKPQPNAPATVAQREAATKPRPELVQARADKAEKADSAKDEQAARRLARGGDMDLAEREQQAPPSAPQGQAYAQAPQQQKRGASDDFTRLEAQAKGDRTDPARPQVLTSLAELALSLGRTDTATWAAKELGSYPSHQSKARALLDRVAAMKAKVQQKRAKSGPAKSAPNAATDQ